MALRTLLAIVLAAGLFAAGWFMGQSSGGENGAARRSGNAVPSLSSAPSEPGNPGRSENQPSDAKSGEQALTDILAGPTNFFRTAALYERVRGASVADLQKLANEGLTWESGAQRDGALSVIYRRFAELDPEAAVDHFFAAGAPARRQLLDALFFTWAVHDLEGAVSRLQRLQMDQDRPYAAHAIMRAHSERDIGFLWELAGRVRTRYRSQVDHIAFVLERRAERAPAAALRQAMSLPTGEARRAGAYAVAHVWKLNDPWTAYRSADQFGKPAVARLVRRAALDGLAEQDPEGVLAMLENGASRSEMTRALDAMMRTLAGRDPQRALAILQSIESPGLRTGAASALFQAWAALDATAAAAAVERMDDRRMIERVASSVGNHFAQDRPEAALRWALRIENHPGQLFRRVADKVSRSNPEVALQVLAELPPSAARAEVTLRVLHRLAEADPALAMTYVEDMTFEGDRWTALSNIAASWANQDPVAVLEWFAGRQETEQHQLVESVARGVWRQRPSLADSAIHRFQGAIRSAWLRHVVAASLHEDVERAARLLAANADDPAYDRLMVDVVGAMVRSDPESALGLLTTIRDDEKLNAARTSLVDGWARIDAPAAARWLESLRGDESLAPAVLSVVDRWARYDPVAAARWVDSWGPGPQRDAGLTAMLAGGRVTTRQAEAMLAEFTGESSRAEAALNYAIGLARTDRERSLAFLRNLDVAESTRQDVLDRFRAQYPGE